MAEVSPICAQTSHLITVCNNTNEIPKIYSLTVFYELRGSHNKAHLSPQRCPIKMHSTYPQMNVPASINKTLI